LDRPVASPVGEYRSSGGWGIGSAREQANCT
jgi:hypothetical protein